MGASRGDAYNPSSLHAEGRRARARWTTRAIAIAALLGASRNEIVFTGGGTESDNVAFWVPRGRRPARAHVAGSAIEHHAVLARARACWRTTVSKPR